MHIALVVSLAVGITLPLFGSAPPQDSLPVAMRTLVQTFQDVWNAHDAARLAELFADDADQIMGNGPVTTGRPAIRRWWEARFAGMERGRSIALSVGSVRMISSDAGVINTVAASGGRDAQAQPLPPSSDRGTWVVVSKAGHWHIAALRVQQAEPASSR